ncbi:hypothetical protein KIH87_12830 [Paraneptunicella aestuarii]|uniref:flagellar basal body rod protein FlgC n=1 Tax=Paraneptunicella aestuarii TaxID=2831148 RepID=UPI001E5C8579|nr:flagellar basal body rod C-terminal domain-containing protein [Paraneptunicella aestuarii]UAA37594.1 hypothetical protein KIH87_12830 [Paraneptunicella aestuarii]
MAVTEVMAIAEFGLQYQKMRVDAATFNIAQANTVQTGKAPFALQTVVNQTSFNGEVFDKDNLQLQQLQVSEKKQYRPEHPAADVQGFVRVADVDMAAQMVVLSDATRAYEANVKAFNNQMNMTLKALEIGK